MSDAQKRRATRITAGPNVGFGPKGNIFPKDAADRRRLMAKYGGTGSAAARAAAQGKQGNMKKGIEIMAAKTQIVKYIGEVKHYPRRFGNSTASGVQRLLNEQLGRGLNMFEKKKAD